MSLYISVNNDAMHHRLYILKTSGFTKQSILGSLCRWMPWFKRCRCFSLYRKTTNLSSPPPLSRPRVLCSVICWVCCSVKCIQIILLFGEIHSNYCAVWEIQPNLIVCSLVKNTDSLFGQIHSEVCGEIQTCCLVFHEKCYSNDTPSVLFDSFSCWLLCISCWSVTIYIVWHSDSLL